MGIGMPISQSRMPRIGAFPLFVDLRTNGGQNAESKSRFLGMGARMLRLVGALQVKKIGREGAAQQTGQIFDAIF